MNINIKNPALVRTGNATLQSPLVSQRVSLYTCTDPAAVTTATTLNNGNSIIVQALWGLGKYMMFVGLGWPFIPLMLALQSIMSLNYLNTQMPLNLRYFLNSFADFRNPSILYNPVRNNFDMRVLNHPELYQTIQPYNVFDHGIDFMKNSF